MKTKKHFRVLGCLLAITLLAGILIVPASADSPEISFLNPLGQIEPVQNQPLEARLEGVNGSTIRLLQHGAANSASVHTMASLQAVLNAAGATALTPAAFGGTVFDSRNAAQYDAWAAGADAVIIGVLEDNAAAWWVGYHAKEIEARGVPVVVIAPEWLVSAVRTGAQDSGFAAMRVVTIPSSPWADAQGYGAADPRRTYIDNNIVGGTINIGASVIAALTDDLTAAELSFAPLTVEAMGLPYADGRQFLSVPGYDATQAMPAFYDLSMKLGFGDGLPLVMPTQEAVDAMVEACGRDADEVLGKVMLRGGIMTVEKVAINAVMAGARPEHFPVILAAIEAYVNGWEDNKLFYNDIISNAQRTLAMVVSGPIVGSGEGQLDLSRGRQYNPGSNDSSSIGRAVMLAIRNVGHMAFENSVVMGASYRINAHEVYVVAEANELLPDGWETLSEQMGFGDGSNTVTLLSLSSARFTGNVGGTSAGGTAGTFDNWSSTSGIRAQGTSTNLNNSPGIWLIHWRDAQFAASTDTRPRADGGLSTAARGLSNKDMVQQFIAGTGGTVTDNGPSPTTNIVRNENREALIWPIVSGFGHSTNGRVFHGGSADYNDSRGFQTQRIGGVTAPSAPQNFNIAADTLGQAVLSWDAPERGTVIRYEVSCDDGRTWIDAGLATSYTFNGLNNGQQYGFVVRARNGIQNSADVRAPGVAGPAAQLDWRASGRGAWAHKTVRLLVAEQIRINSAALVTLRKNATLQLNLTVFPADATPVIIWSSSNEVWAKVDANGLVTAVAPGTVIITAKTADGVLVSTVTVRVTA